jgi:hypothetical protein
MMISHHKAQRFSHFPAPYIFVFPGLIAATVFVALFMETTKTESAAAKLVVGLVSLGCFWLAWQYFKRPWSYQVDDEKLVAERLWGHRCVGIRWDDVAQVMRATKRDLWRNWPEVEVHGRDGTVILIPRNLRRYAELIELIRHHARRCQRFEAHP